MEQTFPFGKNHKYFSSVTPFRPPNEFFNDAWIVAQKAAVEPENRKQTTPGATEKRLLCFGLDISNGAKFSLRLLEKFRPAGAEKYGVSDSPGNTGCQGEANVRNRNQTSLNFRLILRRGGWNAIVHQRLSFPGKACNACREVD
jgi:hypothetical protein